MKKTLALLLVVLTVVALALTGCNAGGGTAAKTEMTISVGSYPDTIDPALNSAIDGGTYIIHAFSGLVGYTQSEDGNAVLTADCAAELPTAVIGDDGKATYTFTLKDGLKWSDGTDLTAEDFVYSWNRAVAPETAADYAYMFDVIDGFEEGKLNVTAKDAKTLEVVLSNDVPYFLELCAFPTYMPVKKDVVEGNEAWATKADTYIGNGPYKVTEFSQSQLVFEKNEYFHDAASVKTDKIICAFNADDTSLYANFQNGSYQFIDSVPSAEIKSIEKNYPEEYKVSGQLGTYYVCFNVNDKALADFTENEKISIRKAISLLLDRQHIVENISQSGEIAANTFVPMSLSDVDGKTDFRANANGGAGYFSVDAASYDANCKEAVKLLEDVAKSSGKFTVEDGKVAGFPALTYITNENTNHEAIASYIQGVLAIYGIDLKIEVQEWNTFLNTRKDGEYSIARNGWTADFNDPISFLDMWLSESGNNDVQFGKGAHKDYKGYSYGGKDNLTWAESYDKLIAEIKACKDSEKRFELMHQAEDILMATGAICPIYYYTDNYMISKSLQGFFTTLLGFKYFMYATVA